MTTVNRKQSDILDTIVDCLIINNSITKKDLIEQSGLSYSTVTNWVELIQKIQDLPRLLFEGKVLRFDAPAAEDVLIENAIAFLGEVILAQETAQQSVGHE